MININCQKESLLFEKCLWKAGGTNRIMTNKQKTKKPQ